MRLVSIKVLRDFYEVNPAAKQALLAWHAEVSKSSWTQPSDIKQHYGNASILKNSRVVFNIKGNEYRLIVAVAYRSGVVYVKFVGSHREYDQVDAETVELD